LKITAIEYVLCRSQLAKPIPLSCGALTHRNFGLIRIATSSGLEGWGETSINFPPWTYLERAATIRDGLAPMLLGEDGHDVLRLRDKMVDATRAFTRMWSQGALAQAISGIEMALWDLLGKKLKLPVATLLGGIRRDTFDCYATGLRTDDPAEGAREAVAAGYKAIKMRVGFDEAKDIAAARSIRAAIGENIALLVDANQAFDLPRARRMLAALAELKPYWVEEPLLSDDFAATRRLRREFPQLPLAWGENSFSLDEVSRVARHGLADYIMPDPCRCGGMAAAMEVARVAARYGIPVSAHHYGSDLGFAAMLHFMAAVPSCDLVLRDIAPVALRDSIILQDLRPVDGQVHLPKSYGFGVTPNLETIARSRVMV